MANRLEPELPFVRQSNGDVKPVQFWWQNVPAIQLETKKSWWGNSVSDTKTGGDYYLASNEPIKADGQFLARKAALAVRDCNVLVKMGVTEKVDAVSRNPYGDRVETEIRVKEKYLEGEPQSIAYGENYGRPPVVPTQEFNIINDIIADTAENIINDQITDGVYDEINDQIIPG